MALRGVAGCNINLMGIITNNPRTSFMCLLMTSSLITLLTFYMDKWINMQVSFLNRINVSLPSDLLPFVIRHLPQFPDTIKHQRSKGNILTLIPRS